MGIFSLDESSGHREGYEQVQHSSRTVGRGDFRSKGEGMFAIRGLIRKQFNLDERPQLPSQIAPIRTNANVASSAL